jgi:hypothetical protein
VAGAQSADLKHGVRDAKFAVRSGKQERALKRA